MHWEDNDQPATVKERHDSFSNLKACNPLSYLLYLSCSFQAHDIAATYRIMNPVKLSALLRSSHTFTLHRSEHVRVTHPLTLRGWVVASPLDEICPIQGSCVDLDEHLARPSKSFGVLSIVHDLWATWLVCLDCLHLLSMLCYHVAVRSRHSHLA